MALLPAGFVDGGSTSAEVLRRLAYAATSGEGGVVQPSDLQVTAAGTPGGLVYVAAGSAFVPTKFSDAYGSQSYIASNDAATAVTVPANTSGSTQIWYVILRITDPQYAGEPIPPDRATAIYAVLELVAALPTTKPYLQLAKLTVPNGASAITAGMISDARVLARARARRDLKVLQVASSQSLTGTSDTRWPDAGSWQIAVPSWATKALVRASWDGVSQPGSNMIGSVLVRIGTGRADVVTTGRNKVDTPSSGGTTRIALRVTDQVTIPATMRGQTVTIDLLGKRDSGSSSVLVDSGSSVDLDIEWIETL
ncbi:hypothetical protein ATK74_0806 [Propionicimonas paludicola]|uniref:Uncharacterized protein n=1 Tax=Propionicimonas paludicola TaxID=185243 RepID=A0A2A9CRN6_9ACTN|nr:hypothetical protein [Propionicimonas paludicola]PFG16272.1 hypothetical protein ATK74_0806 [Propionicimonas paludicola]